jgi:hypothetical protein
MKKLRERWYIILLILSLVCGGFYWYEYRPSQIKKECSSSILEKIKNNANMTADKAEFSYKLCLAAKGL